MTGPLMLTAAQARQRLGFGQKKFARLVRAGVIPVWHDPDTGRRHYPAAQLEEWARNAGTRKEAP